MSSYVSAALRRLVAVRADSLCEYCLMHEDDAVFGCEVDHSISEKHGGATDTENLAYACAFCNRAKGSDIGSIVPRIDRWAEHFTLDGITIVAISDIGEVTARILDFNNGDRLLERQTLQAVGRFPSAAAVVRMASRT